MASQTLQALFLRARDAYESSRRLSGLAVVALLFFHAAAVAPLLELSRRQAAASSERERLDRIAAETSALRPAISNLGPHARETMEPALDELIEGLRSDLRRLEVTRRTLKAWVAERHAELSGDEAAAPEPAPEEDPLADVLPFEVADPDRIVAIGEATTREELLAALDPLVDQVIVRPRFATLNQIWTATVLPQVEAGLDGVAAEIPGLHGRFPEADAEWEELAQALGAFRRTAHDLVFKPPERPYWWAPAQGEPTVDDPNEDVLTPGPEPAVEQQLRSPLVLDELAVTGDRALARFEDLARRVARHREELTLTEQGAGLAAVLDRLALDRQTVVGLFPLILGICLAGLVLAHVRRLQELGWLIHLLLAAGETPGVRTWFLIRQQWGLATPNLTGIAERGALRRVLVRGVPALGWVVYAGAQQIGVEGFATPRVLAVTAAGAIVLAIALVRWLMVSRSMLGFVMLPDEDPEEDPSPEDAARPAAEESDGEILDAHALKR